MATKYSKGNHLTRKIFYWDYCWSQYLLEWGPCYLKTASLSSNEDANTTVHINSLVVVPAVVEEDGIYSQRRHRRGWLWIHQQ